ncbi:MULTISPECIES: hypothetical protein [unclassified Clostridium]|uniref:hypothetical protein n=1 Tax=unclassified Clostridium TaxID=2614128 RepID=UPI0002F4EE60|nr:MULTISPECIES: hypothetical protein [unclassified Clostridium]
MINYEFVIDIGPDKETIREFHRGIAEDLIENFGEETMKEVVRQIKEKDMINEQ